MEGHRFGGSVLGLFSSAILTSFELRFVTTHLYYYAQIVTPSDTGVNNYFHLFSTRHLTGIPAERSIREYELTDPMVAYPTT